MFVFGFESFHKFCCVACLLDLCFDLFVTCYSSLQIESTFAENVRILSIDSY